MRIKVKLSTLIGKMLKIESDTGIRLDAYYLYDKLNKERITADNYERTFNYHQAYNNRSIFDYMFDDEIEKNPVKFLQKCNGHVYVPVCLSKQQKAYIFKFNQEDIKRLSQAPNADVIAIAYAQTKLPFDMLGGAPF